MKQGLFSFALLLLMFMLSSFYSSTTAAQAPAAAPKISPKVAPAPKAKAPSSKPFVPTLPQSPADASDSTPDDITRILRKAKTFTVLTRLLKTTEIMNNVNSQLITTKGGGLTILAPDDAAFSNLKAGFLNSLNEGQKIELLQFHILPQYVSSSNFDSLSNPVQTVAGKDPKRLPLNVESYGSSVNISTGVVNATITGVVYSDNKLAIYRLDKVLLPLDFFVKNAPAAAPVEAKAPKADKEKSASEDEDENTPEQNKSGAATLTSFRGTSVLSLGIAFIAVATLWT
ncbi:fasciclin-like arabinogalactan protein 12 [Abrus precatorius]|uniref:Fasciclin-like arabinogalactan protein 12 n=1 Tax=Abrus precatorius TaxID=3816 RepID=A0A8B8KGE0_ABRPR|nr:fasciclin-like arabinogalactan protein 12 [Abrus precatorius]